MAALAAAVAAENILSPIFRFALWTTKSQLTYDRIDDRET